MSLTQVNNAILQENEELRLRLLEAEEALNAIRKGEVDAIVVNGAVGEQIFSLSSAETPYRILIENMEEGAVTLTDKGIILYSNPRFISMTGRPEGKITGHGIFSFIEKSDLNMFKDFLKKVRNNERRVGEFRILGSSNEEIFCRFAVSTLPEGMTGDMFLIVSDITALKKYESHLENERRRFEETLDIVPAYVILTSPVDFTIQFANKYFKEHFGEPGLSKCHTIIFGRDHKCDICNYSTEMSPGIKTISESTDPNGRIYEITSFPFINIDNETVILEMGVDITEKNDLDKIILIKTFETEENEKKKLASDLHDDLGPTLSAVKMQLTMLTNDHPNEILTSCDAMLEDCINRMRLLAGSISPNFVEVYGLEAALASFISKVEITKKIAFTFTSNLEDTRFRKDIEVHLYRILTELINNTLKHVENGEVTIDLKITESGIQIHYYDNGPGYKVENKPTISSGTGLLNIKSRVSVINGKVSFINRDGHTVVIINVKFPKS